MSADHHSPPPPPEPQTPMWLTIVGCVLFFLVGTWVVTVPADSKAGDAKGPPVASAAASAAPAAPAAPSARPAH